MKLYNPFHVISKNESESLAISVVFILLLLVVPITITLVLLVLEFPFYALLLFPVLATLRVIYAIIKGE